MKVVIFLGSFDFLIFGYLDLIKWGSVFFDYLVVVVMINISKDVWFMVDEWVV